MWFLFQQILTFVFLFATFIYLRSASAVLRSLLPARFTLDMGLLQNTVIYVSPSVLLACALYVAYFRLGLFWISLTAIYVSLALDILYVAGMLNYYGVLRRLRKEPASFGALIRLQDYATWPSTDVARKPLDYLLYRLPIGRRWKKSTVLIKPSHFQKFLKGDLRLIDEAEFGVAALTFPDFCAIPHFSLPAENDQLTDWERFGNWREKREETPSAEPRKTKRSQSTKSFEIEPESVRYYLINRSLNAALSDEAWKVSCKLCESPPFVIARTWKSFHFQESLRLRLVALFNTADLLQRLLGSIVLCAAREQGLLKSGEFNGQEFRIPQSTGQWTYALGLILRSPDVSGFETLSHALAHPREDYASWEERLSPFSSLLGGPIRFISTNNDALAGLGVLTILRDKLIGHGGIGTQLRLRPLFYLSAIHQFFLTTIRDIAKLDLGILVGKDEEPSLILGKDQGLGFRPDVAGDFSAFARKPDGGGLIPLYPYIRYHEGRLMVMNRYTKEAITYVDYNVANIFEPAFITLKNDRNDFIRPRTD